MAAYPVNLGRGTGVCGVTVVFFLPCPSVVVFVMLVLWSTFGSCMINIDGLCVVRKIVSSLMRVLLFRPRALYEMMVNRVSSFIYVLSFLWVRADFVFVDVDVDVAGSASFSSSSPFSVSDRPRLSLLDAIEDVNVVAVVVVVGVGATG